MAELADSVEDLRNQGLANGKPAVLCIISRQPGANIIDTVKRVRGPAAAAKSLAAGRCRDNPRVGSHDTIRTSLRDVQRTLLIAIALVVAVVFIFLRNVRATIIPTVAVPVSLIGTFGAMYLLGFSLDNLSLMSLVVSTGFVVDDAIVVLENVMRHVEDGVPVREASCAARARSGSPCSR